jgi:hypothetical protein
MKILKKTFNVLSFLLFLSFLKINSVFAQIGSTNVGVDSSGWFLNVFVWIISLAGIVSAAVLVLNAYLYITAGGDEGKIQKAAKGITYAIVGLVVASIAFLIVNFVIEGIGTESGNMGCSFEEKTEIVV